MDRRPLRALLTAMVAATAVTVAAVVTLVPDAAGATLPTKAIVDPTPRPLGGVTVIGDSVLLGSVSYSPTLVGRLAEQGWGPIRAQAGGGYSTGAFAVPTSYKASYWITTWRSQGWDPPNVVVNLGANDSGFCGTDVGCAYDAIMHLVHAIGPGHRIWWPKVTRGGFNVVQGTTWNAALDRVASERDDFHTWDWPTVMANGPFPSSDNTHLSPDGYRLRSLLMAEDVTRSLARGERVGGDAPLPEPVGEPSTYVPLPPTRVADTRRGAPGRLGAGDTLTVDLSSQVPEGTTAVAVNLTSAKSDRDGFLSAHPCDRQRSDVSSVNHAAGTARGAMAIVPISADGRLCVYSFAAGHVIVDLQGAFVAGDGAAFRGVPPTRLVDTRETGRADPVVIDAPAGAEAVAVNLTAVRGDRTGFLTADACEGEASEVSNVNFLPGEPVAGAAIVPVSADGTICVWSSVPVDVVVDITGVFGPDGDLRYQPAVPTRTIDVRDGTGGWAPLIGADQVIDARVAPDVPMVTGTLTLVRPLDRGFAVVADCDDAATSNVNAVAGEAMANAVLVGLEAGGRLCVRSSAVAKVLFDTTGWWVRVP